MRTHNTIQFTLVGNTQKDIEKDLNEILEYLNKKYDCNPRELSSVNNEFGKLNY